jgi:antitoxin CptB
METDITIKRLRWQCRRGMREMDMLLERWLDRRYAAASTEQRAAFVRLLSIEDDQLWDHLMGKSRPNDDACAALVVEITSSFSAQTEPTEQVSSRTPL